ncbi:MAG TPA: YegS/Rv2252/BmrU family lipid kinase [Ktedonosporobacter sp.]|nr:YegS/Rv2252/BmrU family lipid kinase [Ktedonosporobacter sp.]
MKCKQASLVINPRAGQNLAKIADILPVLAAAGWSTDLALKEYGGQTMDLAARAAAAGIPLVIAYGGDGTLNQVVNGVMQIKGQHSIVGVIPGGTANVWAGEISLPGDPVKAALTLVDSDARTVDIGHVQVEGMAFPDAPQTKQRQNGKQKRGGKAKATRGAKQHFLLMAGLGVDAAVMKHVSKPLKDQVGALAVGVSAVKEWPKQHPFSVEIRADNAQTLWKGEALQVVIGNTRHYGGIGEMTSEAYIDDGILDVCVITAGDPLTTMEQIVSLLWRRKPDTLTTAFFHGAHLLISVPASVALQLDGSAMKLKDYLSKSDRKALASAGEIEQVMVTYRFDAMPHALQVAIPHRYDDTLFQESDSADHQQVESAQTEAEHLKDQKGPPPQQHQDEQSEAQPEALSQVQALLTHGHKVTVAGVSPHPTKKEAYIVAGSATKQGAGEAQPVAVYIDKRAKVMRKTGEGASSAVVPILQEGEIIVVEGKKSKRGVIWAKQIVI